MVALFTVGFDQDREPAVSFGLPLSFKPAFLVFKAAFGLCCNLFWLQRDIQPGEEINTLPKMRSCQKLEMVEQISIFHITRLCSHVLAEEERDRQRQWMPIAIPVDVVSSGKICATPP